MKNLILAACNFLWSIVFKPAIGSVNGSLVPAELKKAIAAGTGAATVTAFLVAAINAIIPDVPSLFTSPMVASLVSFILVTLLGQLGQLKQSMTGLTHDDLIGSANRPGESF